MTKYVEWIEPFDYQRANSPVQVCRVSVDELIPYRKAYMLEVHGFVYDSDEELVQDFVCERYGKIVEG